MTRKNEYYIREVREDRRDGLGDDLDYAYGYDEAKKLKKYHEERTGEPLKIVKVTDFMAEEQHPYC